MQYKIGILERDNQYLERLMGFLQSRHGDSLVVETADGSGTDWMDVMPEMLGMSIAEYSVLLVGDDISIVTAEIPSDVQIAYLTADAVQDNPLEISKYQRLELIYQQIIAICETKDEAAAEPPEPEDADEADTRLVLDTESRKGENYRVYRLSAEDNMDAYRVEMKMLANNRISGMAGVSYDEEAVRYNITDKIRLVDFVAQNRDADGRDKLLQVFRNILDTLLCLEEYMLLSDRVLLLPEEIYLDSKSLETALLYLPFQNMGIGQDAQQCLQSLMEAGKKLLSWMNEGEDRLTENLQEENTQDAHVRSTEGEAWEAETAQPEESMGTEVFSVLQRAARESLKLKKRTVSLSQTPSVPYLVRRKTGEKVLINRNIFKIGKDENYVDYCIRNNPTISRNHADIVRKSDGYYIVDKGSLNHTFLNGKLVDPKKAKKLKQGDLLQIADEVFEFNL